MLSKMHLLIGDLAFRVQTTIMAACYGDGLSGGVVLGADTRTSSGNYIANRATDKITQLTDKVMRNLHLPAC